MNLPLMSVEASKLDGRSPEGFTTQTEDVMVVIKIHMLLYADDTVVLAESASE